MAVYCIFRTVKNNEQCILSFDKFCPFQCSGLWIIDIFVNFACHFFFVLLPLLLTSIWLVIIIFVKDNINLKLFLLAVQWIEWKNGLNPESISIITTVKATTTTTKMWIPQNWALTHLRSEFNGYLDTTLFFSLKWKMAIFYDATNANQPVVILITYKPIQDSIR